jgi:phosphoribosylformimino-5-aminoimidazole carboxamide ribotide isomerase
MPIRIIPVLDLKAGRAVHAIGGDRAHYRPLRTRLHPTCDPLEVARGFRDIFDFGELYIADLDAIAGMPPALPLFQSIRSLGLDLWIDAGIRDRTTLPPLLDAGVSTLVVGLETARGPTALAAIISEVGPDRLVFSLDLRAGLPVIADDRARWGTTDPFSLARSVMALGVRRLVLLDLARVGTGRGTGTLALLARLRTIDPALEITVGGGIADRDELRALADAGANAVLIGSALHDGRIVAADIDKLN